MLLVDPQYVGRGRRINLRVVVELEPVDLAQVAALAHPQDHGLDVTVEAPEQMRRRHLDEVPGSDSMLEWFEQRVLAYTLIAAEHERVVDLLRRALHSLREPANDVVRLGRVNPVRVGYPAGCL